MEDAAPTQNPPSHPSPAAVRRWLLLLTALAPGVFIGAALAAGFLLDRVHASFAVQLAVLVLMGTVMGLAVAGAVVRHFDYWRTPLRQLKAKVAEIRAGDAPIDDLAQMRGAAS